MAHRAALGAQCSEGKTALHYAAHNGAADAVKCLLAARADPNARDAAGRSALMYAVFPEEEGAEEGGDPEMQHRTAKELLGAHADVALADERGCSALHFAAQHGVPKIIALLVAAKASIAATDREGRRPLQHLAADQPGHKAALQLLTSGPRSPAPAPGPGAADRDKKRKLPPKRSRIGPLSPGISARPASEPCGPPCTTAELLHGHRPTPFDPKGPSGRDPRTRDPKRAGAAPDPEDPDEQSPAAVCAFALAEGRAGDAEPGSAEDGGEAGGPGLARAPSVESTEGGGWGGWGSDGSAAPPAAGPSPPPEAEDMDSPPILSPFDGTHAGSFTGSLTGSLTDCSSVKAALEEVGLDSHGPKAPPPAKGPKAVVLGPQKLNRSNSPRSYAAAGRAGGRGRGTTAHRGPAGRGGYAGAPQPQQPSPGRKSRSRSVGPSAVRSSREEPRHHPDLSSRKGSLKVGVGRSHSPGASTMQASARAGGKGGAGAGKVRSRSSHVHTSGQGLRAW